MSKFLFLFLFFLIKDLLAETQISLITNDNYRIQNYSEKCLNVINNDNVSSNVVLLKDNCKFYIYTINNIFVSEVIVYDKYNYSLVTSPKFNCTLFKNLINCNNVDDVNFRVDITYNDTTPIVVKARGLKREYFNSQSRERLGVNINEFKQCIKNKIKCPDLLDNIVFTRKEDENVWKDYPNLDDVWVEYRVFGVQNKKEIQNTLSLTPKIIYPACNISQNAEFEISKTLKTLTSVSSKSSHDFQIGGETSFTVGTDIITSAGVKISMSYKYGLGYEHKKDESLEYNFKYKGTVPVNKFVIGNIVEKHYDLSYDVIYSYQIAGYFVITHSSKCENNYYHALNSQNPDYKFCFGKLHLIDHHEITDSKRILFETDEYNCTDVNPNEIHKQ